MNGLTVYVDIIWLLNWLFDCLLLYWTAIILKRRVPLWRLVAGGLIGSFIIALAFTSYSALTDNIYMKLLFSVFMVLTVFGFIRLKLFLKTLMTLYFVTFLSGGILLGLHYFFSFQVAEMATSTQMGMNRFGDPMSWLFVALGFPLAWQFSKRMLDGMEMTKLNYEQIVTVTVEVADFKAEFQGLIDSGNQLYDPISRSPVMIVSIVGQESHIPADMLELFENPDTMLQEGEMTNYTWAERIRVIPYKVVGQSHQLLTAIKPDSLRIQCNEKVYEVERGLVSFTLQQLSAENAYQCIVHPKMLTGIPVPSAS
ncbi:sigma-E processing peptidase SpoIIGA [Peribacillus asahii]|uniref:sigma-E processing peptidase SpoIIGA n=1 Tax=Peribacillus asahii TaxID=228899 RepID=UPI003CCC67B7